MRRLALTALAVALVAGACDMTADPIRERAVVLPEARVDVRLASSLKPFDACTPLLDHFQTEAASRATAWGLPWGRTEDLAFATGGAVRRDTLTTEGPPRPSMADDAAVAEKDAGPGSSVSGTNVQEAGVDEPDTVKTDGRRIVTVARGGLQVLVVEDGIPRLAGSLALPEGGAQDLLLAGDRVLVRSSAWQAAKLPAPADVSQIVSDRMLPGQERAVLTLVDIADPARPTVVSTYQVDGHSVGARLVGDVARVVIGSSPRGIAAAYPSDSGPFSEGEAVKANRAAVEETTLTDWLPSYDVRQAAGATAATPESAGLVASCRRVNQPAEFSGLGSLSVLTFDLSDALGDGDAVTVVADGETVYASGKALYVATNRYVAPDPATGLVAGAEALTTEVHKFDIAGDGPARHVASGAVPGHLLNQFSMSEHDGHLRVATTTAGDAGPRPPTGAPEGAPSESQVVILEDGGEGRLTRVGSVGGLGKGERIYAVRFMGPVGYVVTFRQVDPLYTLDLSDPAAPKVVGELKIAGYSAYLHPVGEGKLLGIGQDATLEGRRLGAQVSLFDVSDPAHPARLDQVSLGAGDTPVEYDHHAFLWWEPRGLAVVPFHAYGDGFEAYQPGGAVGLSVAGDGLDEVGRLSHAPDGAPALEFDASISRTIVIDDEVFTFSEAGVLASTLAELTPLRFVSY